MMYEKPQLNGKPALAVINSVPDNKMTENEEPVTNFPTEPAYEADE